MKTWCWATTTGASVLLALVSLAGCGGGDAGRPAPRPRTASSSRPTPPPTETPAPVAEGWGSLRGRFVLDGTPPPLTPLAVAGGDAFCVGAAPVNKAIVRGEKDGLVNAVLYLRLGRNETVKVHPDFDAEMEKPVVLDNKGCEFHPRIVTVRTNQPFVIKNSDQTGHNTNVLDFFNETIAAGEERTKTFNTTMALPNPVGCGIHTFMKGHLLVLAHPYVAVSGNDGSFEIKNVPAGRHEFQVWHEQQRNYLANLRTAGGNTDRSGRAALTIKAGETLDLGDIKIPSSFLK